MNPIALALSTAIATICLSVIAICLVALLVKRYYRCHVVLEDCAEPGVKELSVMIVHKDVELPRRPTRDRKAAAGRPRRPTPLSPSAAVVPLPGVRQSPAS